MLIQKINTDLIDALKSRRIIEVEALRYLLSQIKNLSFDTNHDITDDEIMACIKKTVKQLNQSVESFTKNNREDLAKTYVDQIKIYTHYLPLEIDDVELKALLKELYSKKEADIENNPNKFIGLAVASLKDKASGDRIVRLAQELLKKK